MRQIKRFEDLQLWQDAGASESQSPLLDKDAIWLSKQLAGFIKYLKTDKRS